MHYARKIISVESDCIQNIPLNLLFPLLILSVHLLENMSCLVVDTGTVMTLLMHQILCGINAINYFVAFGGTIEHLAVRNTAKVADYKKICYSHKMRLSELN